MLRISSARRSAGLTSVEGSCCFLIGTVWGNCTRPDPAPPVWAGRLANASGAPPSWGSAPACGTTSSSMLERWNGSIPLARNRRTASKSDVGASSCFCATRRAMRNWRPVSPSWRMASMVFSLATCCGEATSPAGAGRGCAGFGASLGGAAGADACSGDASVAALPRAGADRLMRNFLALGFVVIEPFRFFQCVEHVQLAIQKDRRRTREFFERLRLVRHDYDGGCAQTFLQHFPRFAVKLDIGARWHPFVDQIYVKVEREHQRKGKPRPHPRRIGAQGLVEIFAQVAEPLAETFHIVGVEAVKPRDIAAVFQRRNFGNDAAHKPQRERDVAHAPDFALIGFFQARHHVDQRRLASAIRGKHPQRAAQLHTERHTVKDHLALCACPKGLGYVFEL
mmetsp:Transcript_28862/g.54977  ORF Transcript_28862/g.54977 Transcript_28862/m.54977 type:complete len:395 (+) Transcript_28862:3350-4534(+)